MFKTLSDNPFTLRNVSALKRMGLSAVTITGLFAVKCALYFTPMSLVCAAAILLCGLFSFVLSGVFAEAVRCKQENDLTI